MHGIEMSQEMTASARRNLRKLLHAAKTIDVRVAKNAELSPEGDIAGTGLTQLKLKSTPLAKLIDEHRLPAEAITASDEICTAFHALAARLMVRSASIEKIDGRGRGGLPWSVQVVKAVENYHKFANHWSARAKLGDPTLEIIISAVIDERQIRTIAEDLSFGHNRVRRALIAGLQDYAARAGFVTGGLATRWQAEAEAVFPVIEASLRISEAKIRIAETKLQEAVAAAKEPATDLE